MEEALFMSPIKIIGILVWVDLEKTEIWGAVVSKGSLNLRVAQ
jgi:hypothetical protein